MVIALHIAHLIDDAFSQFQVNIFDVDNDTLKPKVESKNKKKNKTDRRPKSIVSAKQSLAFETMLQWAQDNWWILRGTICDRYGEDNRPFKLGEGRDCRFARDVEDAVHDAVPEEADFKITSPSDKIYGRVSLIVLFFGDVLFVCSHSFVY